MIFRSLWCSFFPFLFLEPKPAIATLSSAPGALSRTLRALSWGRGEAECAGACGREVHCKLTTGCRLERTNRALVLTAFGGVLEKSPGMRLGQETGLLRGLTDVRAQTWSLPRGGRAGVLVCFPPPDATLLSSTCSTRENAQVAAVPPAGD